MTISHEKKLIFIHIPKNAGTSIIKAMGCEDDFYIDKTLLEYKEHYQEYWKEYTKFTVIRDPIDRFISAYKFSRMKESSWFSATGQEGMLKHVHYDLCNKLDLNAYVKYMYENKNEYNRWTIPQTFCISNEKNEIEIDYFVRYENLLGDLKGIGIESIERLNISKIEDIELIKLTKKSKDMLYEIYDIDYYNFHYPKFSYN